MSLVGQDGFPGLLPSLPRRADLPHRGLVVHYRVHGHGPGWVFGDASDNLREAFGLLCPWLAAEASALDFANWWVGRCSNATSVRNTLRSIRYSTAVDVISDALSKLPPLTNSSNVADHLSNGVTCVDCHLDWDKHSAEGCPHRSLLSGDDHHLVRHRSRRRQHVVHHRDWCGQLRQGQPNSDRAVLHVGGHRRRHHILPADLPHPHDEPQEPVPVRGSGNDGQRIGQVDRATLGRPVLGRSAQRRQRRGRTHQVAMANVAVSAAAGQRRQQLGATGPHHALDAADGIGCEHDAGGRRRAEPVGAQGRKGTAHARAGIQGDQGADVVDRRRRQQASAPESRLTIGAGPARDTNDACMI